MKRFIYTLLFLMIPVAGFAQVTLDYYLPDNVSYNPDIPTPEEVIDHQVGEWHITHDKLVKYMYALADASDRVTIEEYARSYEDRPLLLLTITSPENHTSIVSIKQNLRPVATLTLKICPLLSPSGTAFTEMSRAVPTPLCWQPIILLQLPETKWKPCWKMLSFCWIHPLTPMG